MLLFVLWYLLMSFHDFMLFSKCLHIFWLHFRIFIIFYGSRVFLYVFFGFLRIWCVFVICWCIFGNLYFQQTLKIFWCCVRILGICVMLRSPLLCLICATARHCQSGSTILCVDIAGRMRPHYDRALVLLARIQPCEQVFLYSYVQIVILYASHVCLSHYRFACSLGILITCWVKLSIRQFWWLKYFWLNLQ